MSDARWSVESAIIHAGTDRRLGAPIGAPLVPTSTYVSWGEPDPARSYARNGHATWEALEGAIGALEGGEAVLFASGQAAAMAFMLAAMPTRRRIVLPDDGYYNARVLAQRLRPHGAEAVSVDLLDLEAVADALRPGPALLWAETPTNPLLRVADLDALAALCVEAGAVMAVDNTVAAGLLQQPLDHGAVASVYSLTKAASGHSDVILGAVVSRDATLLQELRQWRSLGGGIAGPFEAWLGLRGLRTLALRIARQSETALAIAHHLAAHSAVRAVHYPGMDPATRATAERQMPRGYGPLLSFELTGGAAAADLLEDIDRSLAVLD